MTKFTCFRKNSKFRARVGLGPRYLKGMSGRAGPRAGGFGLGPGSGYEPIGRCRAGPGFGPTSSGSGRVRAENLGPFNTLFGTLEQKLECWNKKWKVAKCAKNNPN